MTAYSSFRKDPPAFCQMFAFVCTGLFLFGLFAVGLSNGDLDGDVIFISIIASGLFFIVVESTLRGFFPACK